MCGKIAFDPRVKLLLFFVSCWFAMKVTQPIPNLCMGVFLTILLCLSGKGVVAIKYFSILCLTVFGTVLLQGKIPGMIGLLLLGVMVLGRIVIPMIMAFTLIFQTTSTSQFMSALQKMKLPVKIIIPVIIMFRFIPTVQQEWIGIRKAMAFRGISLKAGSVIFHPIVTIEHILMPLLFSSTSIIEELAVASLARGLDSDRKRTCTLQIRMRSFDYTCLLIEVGIIGFLLFGNAW